MNRLEHHGLARGKPVLCVDADDEMRMLDHVVEGPRVWMRETAQPRRWTLELSAQVLAEIDSMLRAMCESPLPLLLLHPDQFQLAACQDLMAGVKQILVTGIGLAVLDRLPMENLSPEEATAVFWVLGYLLSIPVATKWDGTMLYDVTNSGQSFGYAVRGSVTNVELPFHTDNAFGLTLPDYVGLLCINPALSGGESRFCSLYTVHNEMLRHHPRLLRRLYEPSYYDRQAEHAPEAPKVLWAPMFRHVDDRLYARLTPNLIRRGYEMMDATMDDALIEALECLEDILSHEDLWIEFVLQRGQIQYLQNQCCAHFRSAFTDSDDPASKRHLVRVWYRESGGRTYDG
jgi:hypothetical protein